MDIMYGDTQGCAEELGVFVIGLSRRLADAEVNTVQGACGRE